MCSVQRFVDPSVFVCLIYTGPRKQRTKKLKVNVKILNYLQNNGTFHTLSTSGYLISVVTLLLRLTKLLINAPQNRRNHPCALIKLQYADSVWTPSTRSTTTRFPEIILWPWILKCFPIYSTNSKPYHNAKCQIQFLPWFHSLVRCMIQSKLSNKPMVSRFPKISSLPGIS